ncbi:hypothetical protein [Streptomyces atratus]
MGEQITGVAGAESRGGWIDNAERTVDETVESILSATGPASHGEADLVLS